MNCRLKFLLGLRFFLVRRQFNPQQVMSLPKIRLGFDNGLQVGNGFIPLK